MQEESSALRSPLMWLIAWFKAPSVWDRIIRSIIALTIVGVIAIWGVVRFTTGDRPPVGITSTPTLSVGGWRPPQVAPAIRVTTPTIQVCPLDGTMISSKGEDSRAVWSARITMMVVLRSKQISESLGLSSPAIILKVPNDAAVQPVVHPETQETRDGVITTIEGDPPSARLLDYPNNLKFFRWPLAWKSPHYFPDSSRSTVVFPIDAVIYSRVWTQSDSAFGVTPINIAFSPPTWGGAAWVPLDYLGPTFDESGEQAPPDQINVAVCKDAGAVDGSFDPPVMSEAPQTLEWQLRIRSLSNLRFDVKHGLIRTVYDLLPRLWALIGVACVAWFVTFVLPSRSDQR